MACCLVLTLALSVAAPQQQAGGVPTSPPPTIRPAHTQSSAVETENKNLAAALALLELRPTPENQLAAGDAYLQAGIRDQALDHYRSAAKLKPGYAPAYERIARVWRDWGMPQFALGDAYRAVYYAPDAASAQNTLGTVLQALGSGAAARERFEKAFALDGSAAWALNNECYSWLVEGRLDLAQSTCRRALEIDPNLQAARENLARAEAGGRSSE